MSRCLGRIYPAHLKRYDLPLVCRNTSWTSGSDWQHARWVLVMSAAARTMGDSVPAANQESIARWMYRSFKASEQFES